MTNIQKIAAELIEYDRDFEFGSKTQEFYSNGWSISCENDIFFVHYLDDLIYQGYSIDEALSNLA